MNDGYMKIPRNVGATNNVPKMYHGVRFPHGVSNISLKIPTSGVIIPSANYPESTEAAPTVSDNPTTLIR